MKKVDDATFERIKQLRTQYGLSIDVIAIRLGLAPRTIRYYLRSARTGERVYAKSHVQPTDR